MMGRLHRLDGDARRGFKYCKIVVILSDLENKLKWVENFRQNSPVLKSIKILSAVLKLIQENRQRNFNWHCAGMRTRVTTLVSEEGKV